MNIINRIKSLFPKLTCTCMILNRGGSGGGERTRRAPPPPKIGKNKIFWRKIVIFHTKYPKNFRASLRKWKKIVFFGVKS
jgi:hypothetical protein